MTQEQHRPTAYRKAGYAVACYAQGRPVPALSPDRPGAEEDEPGRAWPVDLGSGARHRLELEILARWVAVLAEERAAQEAGATPPPGGRTREVLDALGRRITRSPEENEAYLEWLRRRAQGLLDLPGMWAAMEKAAETLLTSGAMSSREATALIAGVQQERRRRSGIGGWLRPLR